ncbi:MAG TPA: site-2 protease family protein [Chthoniobacterales bacterium]
MSNSPETKKPNSTSNPPRGFYVGKILGIEFYLDASWFLLAAFVVWALANQFFPYTLPGRPTLFYYGLGAIAALLFYGSLLLHELGHSVISQRCGIPVPRITLMFIGGMAEIAREPDDPKTEFKIAIGGPAVTVVLVLLFYAASLAADLLGMSATHEVSDWLARGNLVLLIFNAIPGYPLDGGRVLRALIWMRTGKLRQATYISSRVGIAFAWVLMIAGVFFLFRQPFQAFLFFLIGSFLRTAAEAGYQNALYKEVLGDVRVRDVMSPDPVVVPASLPLNVAVDDHFLATHHVAYPVVDSDGEFRGMLRLDHLERVPKEKWPYKTAGDLAAEFNSMGLAISADARAMEAAEQMQGPGNGRLAVLEGSRVIGIVTRHDIFQFIRVRKELQR